MFDYIIIGSGLTALYLVKRLQERNKNYKILVLEKNNYLGGNLLSNKEACDFGPMRYFPSIHPKMDQLIKELGIEVVPTNLYTGDMVIRGKKFNINQRETEIIDDYNITPKDIKNLDDFGSSSNILKEHFKQFMKDDIINFDFKNIEQRKNLIIKYSKYNFRNEIMTTEPVFSEDFYNYFVDSNSYSDIWSEEMSYGMGFMFNFSAVSDAKDQFFFKKGAHSIVSALTKKCKCNHDKKKCCVKFKKNRKVIEIIKNKDSTEIVQDDLEDVDEELRDAKNFFTVKYIKNNCREKYVYGKNVFVCAPADVVDKIPVKIDNNLVEYNNIISNYKKHISKVNLLKIFLQYDDSDAFWGNLRGKTILSSSLNQLYFYSKNIILLYIVAEDAYKWKSYLPSDTQTKFIRFNCDILTDNFRTKLLEQLNPILEEYTLNNVVPKNISWKYWDEGIGFWKSNQETIDIDKLISPFGKDSNIFYLNCDLSWNQLWMEGCLEIVDTFLTNYVSLQ
jgi:hypothetical protein